MGLRGTLLASNKLHKVFGNRTASHHAGESVVEFVGRDDSRLILVLGLALSESILKSRSFQNVNYFSPPLEFVRSKGKSVQLIHEHWNNALVFKEGNEHRQLKKRFSVLLDELSIEIQEMKPRIDEYFRKRKAKTGSPLVFSKLFVRLTTGLIVNQLTAIPLKTVFQVISLRRNVFCNHFVQSRHLASDVALRRLYRNTDRQHLNEFEDERHLLAQSFINMGMDPLIGTICASLVEGDASDMSRSVFRHCPTSYVSRTCCEYVRLKDIDFHPGDVCYLALAPSKQEVLYGEYGSPAKSLAFGVGLHTCIGKRITLVLLKMAEEVVASHFSGGFPQKSVISPDGAFLAFRTTP